MIAKNCRIQTLKPEHVRTEFDCGNAALNKYIRSSVNRDIHNRLARCYVSVDKDSGHITGFFTLSNHTAEISMLPKKYARKIPPGYLVPAVLLGRLGVDKRRQGEGLGGYLLVDAIRRSLSASRISNAFAIITHAKNDHAKSFYSHFGFAALMDDPHHLFLLLKKAEQMFTPPQDTPS